MEQKTKSNHNKISGPLLDRIDMVLTVPPLPKKDLLSQENANAESSEVIRKRVLVSWRPVLVVEEAVVPGENHRPFCYVFILFSVPLLLL
jgi:hypothetical protein